LRNSYGESLLAHYDRVGNVLVREPEEAAGRALVSEGGDSWPVVLGRRAALRDSQVRRSAPWPRVWSALDERRHRAWRRSPTARHVNTRPFLCPRFVRGVPIVAVVYQVARQSWRYEAPWQISVLGRYLLESAWPRAYRDVPVVTMSESSRESLAEYGLRRVTVVPEGWVPA
jgi:hypothetical protein